MTSLAADDVLRAKSKARARVERALRGRGAQSLRWWWAPGRVEVFGKHTDYGGGPSIVGALPRGILVAGARRHDQRLCVVDARDGTRYELDLATGVVATGEATGWRRYADVVARRLGRNFPGALLAADIALASDLPRAAGMSSSSALVVGLAHALVRLAELDRRDDWRAAVRSELDLAGYYACLENGRSFGPLEGDGGVGTFGGSEDHTAIVCARPDLLSQFDYMPPCRVADVALPPSWTFVIASSGVAAVKTGAARGQYNRSSLALSAVTDAWRAHVAPAASLREALASDEGAEARLREVIALHGVGDWSREELDARLTHFVREAPRCALAVAAFAVADRAAIGALAAASHEDADRLLGNQTPETNALVATAARHGAFAASAFGAGFGGSVWALVDTTEPDAITAFGDAWLAKYRLDHPSPRLRATWFAARPSTPLADLTPT